MGLFRSKKPPSAPPTPTPEPLASSVSPETPPLSRSASVKSNASIGSSSSSSKLKSFLKSPKAPETLTVPNGDPASAPLSRNKRISTIVESDIEEANSAYNATHSSTSEDASSSESEDSDYEDHTHPYQPRRSLKHDVSHLSDHLSALMGYCGLGTSSEQLLEKLANNELKRTFSLIQDVKIHRLSAIMKSRDPRAHELVVCDVQVELIEKLKEALTALFDHDVDAQYGAVSHGKSLYERYGVVKHVIGRGAYGLIKIIDPDATDADIAQKPRKDGKNDLLLPSSRTLYAVKELHKQKASDDRKGETRLRFIERVISEFVISATLNSKNIVKTVDLMVTLPPKGNSSTPRDYIASNALYEGNFKVCQVMECAPGGDLYTYMRVLAEKAVFASVEEVECFIKQIAQGLWYMHQHGVAHCDLKLENVLVNYDCDSIENGRGKVTLKISDFGKSSVVRTKWDEQEQLLPAEEGPIGSEPYMAPEEFLKKGGISLTRKDVWALGIIVLVLFNIRRHFMCGNKGPNTPTELSDHGDSTFSGYASSYLWANTDVKAHSHFQKDKRAYKDKVFDQYAKTRMRGDYDDTTKEWLIHQKGEFAPIECLFEEAEVEEDYELCELRKYVIYKLLDPDPRSRLTVGQLMRSDWMEDVESC